MNICDGFIRLSPESEDEKTSAESIYLVTVKLDPIVYEVQKGHSIMIQVSSGAHPHWARKHWNR